jgi:hypothetical protein
MIRTNFADETLRNMHGMCKALWSCVSRFVEGFTLFSHDFISPATIRLINSMGGVNINYSQNIKKESLIKKK